MNPTPMKALSNEQLLSRTQQLVLKERHLNLEILRHLNEIDNRKLYLRLSYSSLFEYVVKELKYSEAAAYRRIKAMKLCRQFPETTGKLKEGVLTLTSACQLQTFFEKKAKKDRQEQLKPHTNSQDLPNPTSSPSMATQPYDKGKVDEMSSNSTPSTSLSQDEKKELIEKASGLSTRQTMKILAEKEPCLALPTERVKFSGQGTVSLNVSMNEETLHQLEQLKSLLSHKNPSMSFGQLISILAEDGVQKYDPQKKKVRKPVERGNQKSAQTKENATQKKVVQVKSTITSAAAKPCDIKTYVASKTEPKLKKRNRAIPTHIRRYIWKRDQGRCTYLNHQSKKQCGSSHFLQIDHIHPFALGGNSDPENLRVLCASHNRYREVLENQQSE